MLSLLLTALALDVLVRGTDLLPAPLLVGGALVGLVLGALLVPDVGEVKLLEAALGKTAAENLTLKLFASNTTPAEGDTAGTYTEASGGGYSAKTLTTTTWGNASTSSGTTSASYAEQTWTFTGALTTNPTIYGYFLVGATSGTLYWAERAAATFEPATSGDTYKVTPRLELA